MDSTHPATRGVGQTPGHEPPRRRPGRPPRLSRQMVIDAAIALDPGTLTLQAVADRLGADRKAVSYYVSGREELLELVTAQALAAELEHLHIPEGSWQEAVRVYARGVRRVLLREASLSLLIDRLPGAGVLVPADALLARLLDAGFDEDRASHALTLITRVVFSNAKDILFAARFARHPTVTEVQRILAELPADRLPHLRRVSARQWSLDETRPPSDTPSPGDAQESTFELELEFIVAGLERLRARSTGAANSTARRPAN
ncbi:TetR/AcrR family transcriptional regulator C-terminal domain-containing protein [Parafrankia elaeagni]|uniref:TetR/AcrR family transcriptional regulator C-terminal domain-containing protein n=1 Tax=Parafrankia elaeagni TaxID=222534 RepID=UPI00036E849D|nr:TetR/AcrR family transcriptional regulator C-terminal domain-containing protein [Parafrankia elaeagni]